MVASLFWAVSSSVQRGLGTQLLCETLSADIGDKLWTSSAVPLLDAVKQRTEQAAVTGNVLGYLLNVTH